MNKRNIILFLILIGFLAIATSCSIAFGEGVEELVDGGSTSSGSIYSNSTYTVTNVSGYYSWTSMTSPSSSYLAFRSTNEGVPSSYAVMKVTFNSYVSSFTFGIRSYAESNYDYVVVSSKNGSIPTSGTGYSSTKGNQSSGTSLSYYTSVTFSNLYSGDYFYVVYQKDSTSSSGDDRGYVVLPVSTSSSSSSSSTYTVSTPTITDYGTYYSDSSYHVIGISCSTSSAIIRYTTNGSTPTTSSNDYDYYYSYYQTTSGSYYNGILVSNGSTVKAMGTYSGYNNSSVASYSVPSVTYTVSTPTITDYGVYASNSSYHVIGISCSTSGATIRFTTNGSTPTTSSSSYSSNYSSYSTTDGYSYYGILVSAGSTVKAMGTYSGYNNSSVASYSVPSVTYTVSTPTITDRGTYYYDTSKHVVTISCSTSGATIRYTTNGSTPTTSSSIYSSNYSYYQTTGGSSYLGILVSNGSTVKAMGTYSGYNNSSVSSYSVPSGSGGSSSYTVSNVSGSSYYSWTTMSSPSSSYNAYRSTNQGQANSSSVMKVTFNSYVSSFTIYIRSYTDSEKNYDYVIVSNTNSSVPSTVSGSKASTYGTSQSGTGVSYYTAVTFNSLYAGDYFYVVFYKDSIYDSGDDTGYVLLPK